jgi:sugar phosphate isomerase/epimerase
MKIGVSSYSYWNPIHEGKLDLFGAIKHAAKVGFEGIEFANLEIPKDVLARDYAAKLRDACKEAGIAVSSTAIGADFSGDIDEVKAHVRDWIDFTQTVGAGIMRTDILYDFSEGLQTETQISARVASPLRELAQYAKEHSVVLVTENHGRLFCESRWLLKLVDWVSHENFRLLLDVGNFADAGCDCGLEVSRLAHLAAHVHLKDFHFKDGGGFYPGEGWFATKTGDYIRGAIVGHGDVGVLKCIKSLDEIGYGGWLTIEFEGIEDALFAVEQGLKNTKRMLRSLDTFRWTESL